MTMSAKHHIRRALISVSDKTGLAELAQQLATAGIDIIATGGTAKLLAQHNIPVTEISDYTGFPEMMGGRLKTLHPKVHGGLLGRRGTDDAVMVEHDIPPIDLVVVNLYPFQKTIANKKCTLEDAVEQIDIGGPTMLRAAAKNYQDITVVVDPKDYDMVLQAIHQTGGTNLDTRMMLATKTFTHTAFYDTAISSYLNRRYEDYPEELALRFSKRQDLRYGENPHQKAAFYQNTPPVVASLASAELLQGKALSFNNLMDSEAAFSCAQNLEKTLPGCVVVKHATPCGAASADTLEEAYQNAFATDPVSAFGGIIACNAPIDEKTAKAITDQQFAEVVIAPDFSKEALSAFSTKKNLRLLKTGVTDETTETAQTLHSISGGMLIQEADTATISADALTVATERAPTEEELADLLFAWQVVKFVKSNAIVYAKNQRTLGIGTGQTSRVFSAKIAAIKADEAGLSLHGAALASDAFFPFADGVEIAAKAGIRCIIQPGGSKRDQEVIDAANKAGIAMVFTGVRHFRH